MGVGGLQRPREGWRSRFVPVAGVAGADAGVVCATLPLTLLLAVAGGGTVQRTTLWKLHIISVVHDASIKLSSVLSVSLSHSLSLSLTGGKR